MKDFERLRLLGEGFKGRLSDKDVNFALGYIDFNEAPLALDALCNYICERDVGVLQVEYGEMVSLNEGFGSPLGKKTLSYLKNLISESR
ncbi:MafI family immunity protein [Burkholderia anthina]|uniref:MafI family immunity protein n=1 Tax=Burkholderia anthina TaxID=179879 RepID=UPI001AA02AEC|nr:MafI family immunity protein [Burkholderia anthina]QTD92431.1 MafI family immunity protein [Burkholderia anthina]